MTDHLHLLEDRLKLMPLGEVCIDKTRDRLPRLSAVNVDHVVAARDELFDHRRTDSSAPAGHRDSHPLMIPSPLVTSETQRDWRPALISAALALALYAVTLGG